MKIFKLIPIIILSLMANSYGVESYQTIESNKIFESIKKTYVETYLLPAMRTLPGNGVYPGYKNYTSFINDPSIPYNREGDPDDFVETQLKKAFEKSSLYVNTFAEYCLANSEKIYVENYLLPIMRNISPANRDYPGYKSYESLILDMKVPFSYSTDIDEFYEKQVAPHNYYSWNKFSITYSEFESYFSNRILKQKPNYKKEVLEYYEEIVKNIGEIRKNLK